MLPVNMGYFQEKGSSPKIQVITLAIFIYKQKKDVWGKPVKGGYQANLP